MNLHTIQQTVNKIWRVRQAAAAADDTDTIQQCDHFIITADRLTSNGEAEIWLTQAQTLLQEKEQ